MGTFWHICWETFKVVAAAAAAAVAIEICHRLGWYPDMNLAALIMAPPHISWTVGYLIVLAIIAGALLFAEHWLGPYLKNYLNRRARGGVSQVPLTTQSRPLELTVGQGREYETIGKAGVNLRRTVKVKIQNNTDDEISDGQLNIFDLDPPDDGQTEFLLRGAITIRAYRSKSVEVACYDEGTSSGAYPGTVIMLCVPPFLGWAPDHLPGYLPLRPHIFQLRFSSTERGVHDDIYCRLFLDNKSVLRLENWGDSRASQTIPAQISLHDAAVRFYEAAEDNSFLQYESSPDELPEERLGHFKHLIMVDDQVHLFGVRPPSTKLRPIPKLEPLDDFFPGKCSTIMRLNEDVPVYVDVSLPESDLAQVINGAIEHYRRLRQT